MAALCKSQTQGIILSRWCGTMNGGWPGFAGFFCRLGEAVMRHYGEAAHSGHHLAKICVSISQGHNSGKVEIGSPVSKAASSAASPQASGSISGISLLRLGESLMRYLRSSRWFLMVVAQLLLCFWGCHCHFIKCMSRIRRWLLRAFFSLLPMLSNSSRMLSQSRLLAFRVRKA